MPQATGMWHLSTVVKRDLFEVLQRFWKLKRRFGGSKAFHLKLRYFLFVGQYTGTSHPHFPVLISFC